MRMFLAWIRRKLNRTKRQPLERGGFIDQSAFSCVDESPYKHKEIILPIGAEGYSPKAQDK